MAILRRYEGVYSFKELEGLALVVRVESGRLVLYQDGERIGALKPESETVFFEDPSSAQSIAFEPAEDAGWAILMDWQGATWRGERP